MWCHGAAAATLNKQLCLLTYIPTVRAVTRLELSLRAAAPTIKYACEPTRDREEEESIYLFPHQAKKLKNSSSHAETMISLLLYFYHLARARRFQSKKALRSYLYRHSRERKSSLPENLGTTLTCLIGFFLFFYFKQFSSRNRSLDSRNLFRLSRRAGYA